MTGRICLTPIFKLLKLYIDWCPTSLLIKLKDVFPGYAQDCFMFDKLVFRMSHVVLLSAKIYNLAVNI